MDIFQQLRINSESGQVNPASIRELELHTHIQFLNITHWVAQMVKSLPAMWETQVQSLGQEDPPGEGNGTPLQDSCLGNSMDREAWQAIVPGAAEESDRTE